MKNPALVLWTLCKVVAVIAVAAWCALYLRKWDRFFPFHVPALCRLPGLVLMMAGGIVVLACGAILGTRGIGTPGNRLFPKEFVASGPFRFVRNPMSLAVVVLFIGLGMWERSPAILLLAILILAGLHLLVVLLEEPGLERRFGDSYRDYSRSVHRWLPSLHRKANNRQ